MPQRIRTAVIGCGKWGISCKAYQALDKAQLVACYNRTLPRARAFGETYGIPAYDDIETMIAKEGVQAVSICTPHPNHAEAAVLCAKLGVHIAVEKPLAASLTDCDLILSAVENAGVTGTPSACRFYPPAQRVKQAICDATGPPHLARPICWVGAIWRIIVPIPGAAPGRARGACW